MPNCSSFSILPGAEEGTRPRVQETFPRNVVYRFPLITFFILAYAISWSGVIPEVELQSLLVANAPPGLPDQLGSRDCSDDRHYDTSGKQWGACLAVPSPPLACPSWLVCPGALACTSGGPCCHRHWGSAWWSSAPVQSSAHTSPGAPAPAPVLQYRGRGRLAWLCAPALAIQLHAPGRQLDLGSDLGSLACTKVCAHRAKYRADRLSALGHGADHLADLDL